MYHFAGHGFGNDYYPNLFYKIIIVSVQEKDDLCVPHHPAVRGEQLLPTHQHIRL